MVLAAGESTRMGEPKQLLQYNGQSLLNHTVQEAVNANAGPVVVVLGANAGIIIKEVKDKKVSVVENKEWQEGMASSVRAGIMAVQKIDPLVDGAIIMVCDQPFLSASLLNELVNKQRETGKPIVSCNYGKTIGPPALFHKSFFPELMKLKGDAGARKIIQQHSNEVATVLFPEGSIDIDTKKDFEELVQKK